LLLTEHYPVYTIGKGGTEAHLLVPSAELNRQGVEVFNTDRGGDITYHGPGQLVGYPILDLSRHYRDVHRYLRDLEEVLLRALADFGIAAGRNPGLTGVWVRQEKIAAIGVKVSRWITMHGFALNVHTDLGYFGKIIPCGIVNKGVTSMARVLGHPIDLPTVAERVVHHFGEVFSAAMIPGDLPWEMGTQLEVAP